jgi:restriction endonuclease S subunit
MGLIDQNFTKINELIYGLNEKDRLLEKQRIYSMMRMISLLM